MTWGAHKLAREEVTPALLYEVTKRHSLVPDSVEGAVRNYHAMARDSIVLVIKDGEGREVATVVVSSITPGDSAEFDLVPVPARFRRNYRKRLNDAMAPLWLILFGELMLRRVTALVPSSRPRTVRALKSLGFRHEGLMRDGVQLRDQDPEDLCILGLLRDDIAREG